MEAKHKKSRLLSEVQDLLKNRPKWLTHAVISKSVGVSVGTVSGIETGTIKNPGVNIAEALHDYLSLSSQQGR